MTTVPRIRMKRTPAHKFDLPYFILRRELRGATRRRRQNRMLTPVTGPWMIALIPFSRPVERVE
jgi:hypothetical protein